MAFIIRSSWIAKYYQTSQKHGKWHWSYKTSPSQYLSKLLIRSSKIFLYLLKIAIISSFSSTFPITYLNTFFQKIVIFWFWYKKEVLAHVFPQQTYALMKQIFSICNIVHQSYAYQSFFLEPRLKLNCIFSLQ